MDSVRTGMMSASLAKRDAGTTFGQDSWGARPRIASQSTIWGSISHERPSPQTVCPAEAARYFAKEKFPLHLTFDEKPVRPTTCPAEASISYSDPSRSLLHNRPNVPIVCTAKSSMHISEGVRQDAPHKARNASLICPAEASIQFSRGLRRSVSHGQLGPSAICPAEASIHVSGRLGRSASQKNPRPSTVCPAEASILFSDCQGRIEPRVSPNASPVCAADDSIHFPERQRRRRPRPKPVTPSNPMLITTEPAPKPLAVPTREAPPRPPPPPEELRPDLTCFQPRLLGQNSMVVSCEKKRKEKEKDRKMSVITHTTQWEVRVEGGCI